MKKAILHIGAHRTGTTSLQRFLRENSEFLVASNIEILCPPESRAGNSLDLVTSRWKNIPADQSGRILISEENLLGTMEDNTHSGTLYPNASFNLAKLGSIFKPDVVALSIRELGEYWTSSLTFSYSRGGIPFPTEEKVADIAKCPRTWLHVFDDIVSAFPDARVVVREFEYFKDNPKRFLKQVTDWSDWNETKLNRRVQNKRPAENELISRLLEQRDFSGLSSLGSTPETQVFSNAQRTQMFDAYQNDIEELWATLGTSFLEERTGPRAKPAVRKTWPISKPPCDQNRITILNIGKTGGSMLSPLLKENAPQNMLHLGGHGDTLISTIKEFGRSRKLAFFFRDPEKRFVAGFYARLRQGRPKYDAVWTAGEAVAFSMFRSPNELAEALDSKDNYKKSAARFSMETIFHLKYGYAHYLTSVDALKYESLRDNIVLCCETEKIRANADKILDTFNLQGAGADWLQDKPEPDLTMGDLTEQALANIKKYWRKEYDIFAECQLIADRLGFAK